MVIGDLLGWGPSSGAHPAPHDPSPRLVFSYITCDSYAGAASAWHTHLRSFLLLALHRSLGLAHAAMAATHLGVPAHSLHLLLRRRPAAAAALCEPQRELQGRCGPGAGRPGGRLLQRLPGATAGTARWASCGLGLVVHWASMSAPPVLPVSPVTALLQTPSRLSASSDHTRTTTNEKKLPRSNPTGHL